LEYFIEKPSFYTEKVAENHLARRDLLPFLDFVKIITHRERFVNSLTNKNTMYFVNFLTKYRDEKSPHNCCGLFCREEII